MGISIDNHLFLRFSIYSLHNHSDFLYFFLSCFIIYSFSMVLDALRLFLNYLQFFSDSKSPATKGFLFCVSSKIIRCFIWFYCEVLPVLVLLFSLALDDFSPSFLLEFPEIYWFPFPVNLTIFSNLYFCWMISETSFYFSEIRL